ncbi:MAG: hypothetical protein IKX03_02700, partial [Bacteroidales bacterium]|nr:hypothetical protein [Bacteroidales bacterium]
RAVPLRLRRQGKERRGGGRFARRFSPGVSLGEMFSYVWGYDPDSGRRYDTEFVVLTLGPTFKIWF